MLDSIHALLSSQTRHGQSHHTTCAPNDACATEDTRSGGIQDDDWQKTQTDRPSMSRVSTLVFWRARLLAHRATEGSWKALPGPFLCVVWQVASTAISIPVEARNPGYRKHVRSCRRAGLLCQGRGGFRARAVAPSAPPAQHKNSIPPGSDSLGLAPRNVIRRRDGETLTEWHFVAVQHVSRGNGARRNIVTDRQAILGLSWGLSRVVGVLRRAPPECRQRPGGRASCARALRRASCRSGG